MLAKAALEPTGIFDGVHIRFCGNGHLGFRPYGDSLFLQAPKKSKQKNARPKRPAPRLGSAFLRSGIHLGASPPVGFASTSSRCVRLRRTALRACPQMNTSTQPSEGAGRSRSRAAGELTLGLLSGEKRKVYADPPCGSELARDGGLTADQLLAGVSRPVFPGCTRQTQRKKKATCSGGFSAFCDQS